MDKRTYLTGNPAFVQDTAMNCPSSTDRAVTPWYPALFVLSLDCAFTDQYAGLEALYRRHKDQGLVVLGFPSNDFGNQEPGSNAKIAEFCRLTYGVQFPMFEKTHVIGPQRNAFYAELKRRTGEAPRWNFHKYLIDATGERVMSFGSNIAPDDRRLLEEMRKMLDAQDLKAQHLRLAPTATRLSPDTAMLEQLPAKWHRRLGCRPSVTSRQNDVR